MTTKKKNPKQWWEMLDWSLMSRTWEEVSIVNPKLQKMIMEKGYWSLGKGKFEQKSDVKKNIPVQYRSCGKRWRRGKLVSVYKDGSARIDAGDTKSQPIARPNDWRVLVFFEGETKQE